MTGRPARPGARQTGNADLSEDPREYGLTAGDLHAAADLLYPPDDPRLQRPAWTLAETARFGRIRSRLRAMADAIERTTTS